MSYILLSSITLWFTLYGWIEKAMKTESDKQLSEYVSISRITLLFTLSMITQESYIFEQIAIGYFIYYIIIYFGRFGLFADESVDPINHLFYIMCSIFSNNIAAEIIWLETHDLAKKIHQSRILENKVIAGIKIKNDDIILVKIITGFLSVPVLMFILTYSLYDLSFINIFICSLLFYKI